jgi:hypothetical protein
MGPVTFNPWLVLQVTASPTSVPEGGMATVVADLTRNSAGTDTSALGHLPDGIPVSFATTSGTIMPPTGVTASGKAVAQFTAGSTLAPATVSATVDNQTSTATINVTPLPSTPPPFVSVALGPFGLVAAVVYPNGVLIQYDVFGVHPLLGGTRAAGVAFGPFGEVLDVVFQNGVLTQIDAFGVRPLLGGVSTVGVTFSPLGQVMVVVFQNGTLVQFDPAGVRLVSTGVAAASVAFGPLGEVLLVVFPNGTLVQFDSVVGARPLLGGVLSAGLALGRSGALELAVLDVIFSSGALFQFDNFGIHLLGKVF